MTVIETDDLVITKWPDERGWPETWTAVSRATGRRATMARSPRGSFERYPNELIDGARELLARPLQ